MLPIFDKEGYNSVVIRYWSSLRNMYLYVPYRVRPTMKDLKKLVRRRPKSWSYKGYEIVRWPDGRSRELYNGAVWKGSSGGPLTPRPKPGKIT